MKGGGTDAKVTIELIGTGATKSSGPHRLRDSDDHEDKFERGHRDTFHIAFRDIGEARAGAQRHSTQHAASNTPTARHAAGNITAYYPRIPRSVRHTPNAAHDMQRAAHMQRALSNANMLRARVCSAHHATYSMQRAVCAPCARCMVRVAWCALHVRVAWCALLSMQRAHATRSIARSMQRTACTAHHHRLCARALRAGRMGSHPERARATVRVHARAALRTLRGLVRCTQVGHARDHEGTPTCHATYNVAQVNRVIIGHDGSTRPTGTIQDSAWLLERCYALSCSCSCQGPLYSPPPSPRTRTLARMLARTLARTRNGFCHRVRLSCRPGVPISDSAWLGHGAK